MKKQTVLLGIPIFMLAVFLYFQWGDPTGVINYYRLEKASKNLPAPDKIITELTSHLAQHPNSAQGWYLLGRLYASQNNFSQAAHAFQKANSLKPHEVKYLINYAQSLFMQQNPIYYHQTQTLLMQANRLAPHNPVTLNLLALTAYQQKNYPTAIQIWESLLEQFPPNTPDGKALLKAIAKAQTLKTKRHV